VFYVVPRVEGIEDVSAKIREMVPAARIAVAHGQMDEGELESTMLTFSNGDAEVLVCTTIIESGLDIPRVNTILVEDAHRFGLSQLYQLRGRVGGRASRPTPGCSTPKKPSPTKPASGSAPSKNSPSSAPATNWPCATWKFAASATCWGRAIGPDGCHRLRPLHGHAEEAIAEIRGQDIPQVEDTQVDLNVTAFVPNSKPRALMQMAADLSDRYGPIPPVTAQLQRMLELKLVAKALRLLAHQA
jgi:transcription-repair coupling factor (superfamily II helicase)